MKILHLDDNHPLLIEQLENLGFTNVENYNAQKLKLKKTFINLMA